MSMRKVSLLFALTLLGCGGEANESTASTGMGGSAGASADAAASDAGAEAAADAAPFDGPCDATGSWSVSYATKGSSCELFALDDVLHVDPTAAVPVTVEGQAAPDEASLSADGCSVNVKWSDYYEQSGEMNGFSNELSLTLTSPTTAAGTLTHGEYWWCAGMFGEDTFAAEATRQ
jgi:hypothetical protein